MIFRIVYLPAFKAVSSGVDANFDFSENGVLGKFDKFFSAIKVKEQNNFMPRDFLFFDEEKKGMVWWWALTEETNPKGYETVDFEGGYYLTYVFKDGDEKQNQKLYNEAIEYIKSSNVLMLDSRKNHYPMGHIITPQKIIDAQGWAQMEVYVPVKLK